MNYDNKKAISNHENKAEAPNDVSSNLSDIDTLSQYLKSSA